MAVGTLGRRVFQKKPLPERAIGQAKEASLEFTLGKDMTWTVEGSTGWQVITCLEGLLWVTQENEGTDHILTAGEAYVIMPCGRVVVEGITGARVRVTACAMVA